MSNAAHDMRIEPAMGNDRQDAPAGGNAFIPPLPRISIQAFCETPDTQMTLAEASADRRAQRAQMSVQMGGIGAAIDSYEDAPTPNVIVIESLDGGESLLRALDTLAGCCDPGNAGHRDRPCQ